MCFGYGITIYTLLALRQRIMQIEAVMNIQSRRMKDVVDESQTTMASMYVNQPSVPILHLYFRRTS